MALFSVDVFHHLPTPPALPASLTERLDRIMETQSELAVAMVALKEQNERDRAETLALIAALQAAIETSKNTLDPAVIAAFNDLQASVQARDTDVVPPAPPAEPQP